MTNCTFYFAYGSNMAVERLRARVSSAKLICVATLMGHALRFHKPSKKDGSGKCDAAYTGSPEDKVLGALYAIHTYQLPELDKFEGRGYGYERKAVMVTIPSTESVCAETYVATKFDSSLRPLDWYKEHVLRGARAIGLPPSYIASIEAVVANIDIDEQRRTKELAIYS